MTLASSDMVVKTRHNFNTKTKIKTTCPKTKTKTLIVGSRDVLRLRLGSRGLNPCSTAVIFSIVPAFLTNASLKILASYLSAEGVPIMYIGLCTRAAIKSFIIFILVTIII